MTAQTDVDLHYVTAILVTHNGAVWLPEVVAALASQTRTIDQVIAIDTGSQDNSVKLLRGARIDLISAKKDCGFGQAVLMAVEELPDYVEGESEWLWLIHDDCAPAPGALEALLKSVADRPQVAIVGPKLLGWHDRTHLLEVGISIAGNGARWTGLETFEYDQGQRDGIHDVLAVSTAGALIRRDVFEELGGFDLNLSLFRDDVDFGWRARVAGHSVIAVTDAVVFHAEAAASERRTVDVDGAFLHRPLLLDRRNAAYVLLANSSWWMLPLLAIQLLTSAIMRSIGYLLAKLPGYASDELLAVATLLIRPQEIIKGRKARKENRLVSPRVISAYIPPRWSQLRLGITKTLETIKERFLPSNSQSISSPIDINDEEDLLVPQKNTGWNSLFRSPGVLSYSLILIFSLIWSRNRLGSLSGGAMPSIPTGASDLWRTYFDSWHQVGMGSSIATPPWIALLALGGFLFFGKLSLFVTILFLALPLLFMWSSHSLFSKMTKSPWLAFLTSGLYAISPVAIASINSARLGTIVVLLFAPLIPQLLPQWKSIENHTWRRIFGMALLISVIYSFTLMAFLITLVLSVFAIVSDYLKFKLDLNQKLFNDRLFKRLALIFIPIFLTLPYSFESLLNPSRLFAEPGFALSGGGPNLAILGNPGGTGSLPWWLISPILLMLVVALFSTSSASFVAEYGFAFLLSATLLSSIALSMHGNSAKTHLWTGTLLVGAVLSALCCSIIILDKLREHLVATHIHYRHYLSALLVLVTLIYTVLTLGWTLTKGADSPVRSNAISVMPAFLGVEQSTKTLVIRAVKVNQLLTLQYFISHGSDISIGDPDLAPAPEPAIEIAVRELIDDTGILSSETFANYGIKYVFVKNPSGKEIIRTIDGIGGFTRASATSAGIVWRVTGQTGRLLFTDETGIRRPLEAGEFGARTIVPSPGIITLTQSYSNSWQIIENGVRLPRIKNDYGLPTFTVTQSGEFSLIHDGTSRRAWISLQVIVLVLVIVLAAPARRRKREIADRDLA